MANYPLEYGWHTGPDTADASKSPDSSPATERYPLEWGVHLEQTKDDAPQMPVFTPVMPTLLGGAGPDGFDAIASEVTPVRWNRQTSLDGPQIAQAGVPPANDNRTAHEICDQAFAESNAVARIHPSLSPDEYLGWRKEAREVYDFCLNRADHPAQLADRIEFPGGGVVIIRRGLAPRYVPPPSTGRSN
jgi:hypothetical protein